MHFLNYTNDFFKFFFADLSFYFLKQLDYPTKMVFPVLADETRKFCQTTSVRGVSRIVKS